ncbi:MAG: hypothetical protein H6502_02855 [Candidatus Woesearchaeota archaeon]|nr:MAG: hypothetical protein H6502_02855 [Candidatus Woesearchaeota archaeon]
MADKVRTQVDDLVDAVKAAGTIGFTELSKKLGVPEKTVQQWTDFLVDEKILGIEYKFTKPVLFFIDQKKEEEEPVVVRREIMNLADFRNDFITHAKEKNMPQEQIPALWQAHLKSALENQKSFFISQARKRGYVEPDALWTTFVKRILEKQADGVS